MLGALPAIGFMSTGATLGSFAAYGAIAGFSATVMGPPRVNSPDYNFNGPTAGYSGSVNGFNGPTAGYTGGAYSFNSPTTTGGVNGFNGPTGGYPGGINGFLGPNAGYTGAMDGHLNNAVWNLNASPWNDVNYGQLQAASCYCQTEYPYNGVQYQSPAVYPPGYVQPMGSYDVSQSFGNSYMYGSVTGYQNSYQQMGYPTQAYGSMPYGYCQPAYANPAAYMPTYQPSQVYSLQSQQAGMYSFGSQTQSSYQYAVASTPTGVDSWAHLDGGGKVSYPNLPPFESTTSWVGAAEVVDLRLVGSEASKSPFSYGGNDPRVDGDGRADERTTVWWALQQNDRLRFNTDSNEFFITYPDGSTRAVDTLANALSVRQGAGWDGQVAYKAFGDHVQATLVTGDVIYPPYQPGASALTTQPFGTQWDRVFPRPDLSHLYGFSVPNQGPSSTTQPPNGLV